MALKNKKSIPFEFVLEKLDALSPVIKPMFGCHALYVAEKIILVLRKKEKDDPDNGVWVATQLEFHASLKKDFPSLTNITLFGEKGTWQILPEEAEDFEESVLRLCDMVLKRDPRIGKIPKAKKKK